MANEDNSGWGVRSRQKQIAMPKGNEDFFDICNKVDELVKAGMEEIKYQKEESENNWQEKKDVWLTDDYVSEKVNEISKFNETLSKKVIEAIGQMYNGILVDGELSMRNGEAFQYKCRYTPSAHRIFDMLQRNKKQVEDKLKKRGVDSNAVFDVIELLIANKKQESDDAERNIASIQLKIKPIKIIDFESSWRNESLKHKIIEIDTIDYEKGGVTFKDTYRDRAVNNHYVVIALAKKFRKEIDDIKKKVYDNIIEREAVLAQLSKTVDDKLGKYLLLAGIVK